MADPEQLRILLRGVAAWNKWRDRAGHGVPIDLSRAVFHGTNLRGANLSNADLHEAFFDEADLCEAGLRGANLSKASLSIYPNHSRATNLSGADLRHADLDLSGADLRHAILNGADLRWATLSGGAKLNGAELSDADLRWATLSGADLRKVNLTGAVLVETDFTDADLTGCRIYGVSAWGIVSNGGTKQQNLIIVGGGGEPVITVDNIEVAQFIYLLLHNAKIRDAIDTITSKAVLILGRFTDERKSVLDALRDELRRRNYLPILFDFDKPGSQDRTATVSTLAHLSRFIIADLTDPRGIPYELATVVPNTPVPVQPILLAGEREFAMFADLRRRHSWVLKTHHYDTPAQLLADLSDRVIGPAEAKVSELRATMVAPLNPRTTP